MTTVMEALKTKSSINKEEITIDYRMLIFSGTGDP